MKTKKILVSGLIAVILMFALIACDDGNDPNNGNGDPNGGGGKTSFGDKLELSGQVYTFDWDDDEDITVLTEFEGNLALKSDAVWGASGEIKGGKLTYTVGVPPASSLQAITNLLEIFSLSDDSTISDESVKFAQPFYIIEVIGSNTYQNVAKGGMSANANGSTTIEWVMFMYVDNPVIITAKGSTEDINLSLKTGWNALHYKYSNSGTKKFL